MVKKFKIDMKDKKILYELNWDARQSNAELARKVGLSKKAVEYRVKQLEDKKIILGYYPVIDFLRLGNHYGRTFIKLQYVTSEVKSKMDKFIKETPELNWSLWMSGEYDLGIGIWIKSLADYKRVFFKFSSMFEKYIKKRFFSIATELTQYPYRFLLEKDDSRRLVMSETRDIYVTDELDKEILIELNENARKTLIGISRKLGVNYKTVADRIKRLQKAGVLLTTRAVVNNEALGYTHYKLLLNLTHDDKKKIAAIKEDLRKNLNTVYFVDEIGISDIDVEMMIGSNREFIDIIEALENKYPDMIKEYRHIIFTDTIKVSFLPYNL